MLSKELIAAAGNAGGDKLYVDDVFSTYLYDGNSSSQTITNGIDLAGEGGLVWIKDRDTGSHNILTDTERGATKVLWTGGDGTYNELTEPTYLTAFNSDGFSLGSGSEVNGTGPVVSWSFRKAEKFFDVVTYTGNGTAGRTISHNLGSQPAVMIIKNRTTNGRNWEIYHESLGNTKSIEFTNGAAFTFTAWNNTSPTDSVFTVSADAEVNANGESFVAYLFASDAGGFGNDGSEDIIKCASYTGNGSTDGPEIDLGFEPQWLLFKNSDSAENWFMFDVMRGWTAEGSPSVYLRPHLSNAESSPVDFGVNITSTGFKINTNSGSFNTNGDKHIYIAIRRPMKTPESGTEVFSPNATTTFPATMTTGFPVDLTMTRARTAANYFFTGDRLRGNTKYLSTATTNSESTFGSGNEWLWDSNTTITQQNTLNSVINYNFKRATGFFDVVAYTGTNSGILTNTHNLGVTPELMIGKARGISTNWYVFHKDEADSGWLQSSGAFTNSWRIGDPTSSTFDVRGINNTASALNGSSTYIAYLFATLAGVSKVGSYTGTGSNINVDCGFSAGARFILIKRADGTGDWYVYDSERGIVAGNDPYLLLNSTAAEVTSTDYIDPLNAGFTVTSSAPAALNASGGTYIFLSIA